MGLPAKRLTEAGITKPQLEKFQREYNAMSPEQQRLIEEFFAGKTGADIQLWLEVQIAVTHFSAVSEPTVDPEQVGLDEGLSLLEFVKLFEKGAAEGVATLDGEGRLTLDQVPPSVSTKRLKPLGKVSGVIDLNLAEGTTFTAELTGATTFVVTNAPERPTDIVLIWVPNGHAATIEKISWVGSEPTFNPVAATLMVSMEVLNGGAEVLGIQNLNLGVESVTSENLQSGSVTSPKIAAGAVTESKLGALAVVAEKIAEKAVEAKHIAAGAVTEGKIANGAVTAEKLAGSAVTAGKIAAEAVETAKIKAGAVTTACLAAASVTAEKLAAEVVETAKIKAAAVTTACLAAAAVTAEKIAEKAVEAKHIAAEAVTEGKIANLAVTATKLAGEAVTGGKIAKEAIASTHLSPEVKAHQLSEERGTIAEVGEVPVTAPALASYGFTEAQAKQIITSLNEIRAALHKMGITK